MSLDLAAESGWCKKRTRSLPKLWEGTLILGVVGAGQAVSHPISACRFVTAATISRGGLSGVGVVAIHQHVGFGIDLAEHAAHDVALTLLILVPDDSTSLGGQLGGAVGRNCYRRHRRWHRAARGGNPSPPFPQFWIRCSKGSEQRSYPFEILQSYIQCTRRATLKYSEGFSPCSHGWVAKGVKKR